MSAEVESIGVVGGIHCAIISGEVVVGLVFIPQILSDLVGKMGANAIHDTDPGLCERRSGFPQPVNRLIHTLNIIFEILRIHPILPGCHGASRVNCQRLAGYIRVRLETFSRRDHLRKAEADAIIVKVGLPDVDSMHTRLCENVPIAGKGGFEKIAVAVGLYLMNPLPGTECGA